MKEFRTLASLGFLLIALSTTAATAQTINALSCNQSDVIAALNKASSSTTTVVIPSCPSGAAWTSQGNYTIPSTVTNLTIQGQTSCTGSGDPAQNNLSCNDATVIEDSLSGSGGNALNITVGTGKVLRITGVTFVAGSRSISDHGSLVVSCTDDTSGSGQFRFDHNHASGVSTFMSTNDCFGVMDHNIFSEGAGNQNYLHVWQPTYNQGQGSGNGDGSWAANTDFGTMKFMYLEANKLDNGTDDCTFGGRVVARFNTIVNGSSLQTHPTGGGGSDERGCRAYEIYGNNFSGSNSNPAYNGIFMSSGTALIWDNTSSGGYEHAITLHSMRRDNSTYPETAAPNGWGYCGTSFNGTGSPWDQNTNASTGYPCIDQPGRGKGDLITGMMPSAIDLTSGKMSWVHEALEPVYEWGDKWTPAPGYNGWISNSNPDVLSSNVDYYLWCNASSPTGCSSSFNGSQGTGQGTRASRPSTCTSGVVYFSTDQGSWNSSGNSAGNGVLDLCSSTNSWTNAFYTPYTYPHPLASGSQVVAPAPPFQLPPVAK